MRSVGASSCARPSRASERRGTRTHRRGRRRVPGQPRGGGLGRRWSATPPPAPSSTRAAHPWARPRNNVAEYSGMIEGLRAASAIDPAADVLVRMDSKLVVEQMSGRWKIKHDDMRRLALRGPRPRGRDQRRRRLRLLRVDAPRAEQDRGRPLQPGHGRGDHQQAAGPRGGPRHQRRRGRRRGDRPCALRHGRPPSAWARTSAPRPASCWCATGSPTSRPRDASTAEGAPTPRSTQPGARRPPQPGGRPPTCSARRRPVW